MPHTLSFDDFSLESTGKHSPLWSLQDQVVQVRGFWYPLSSQEGILSPQPHLKSCCLKSPTQLQHQLLVKGALESLPAQRALTLQGIFKIDPRYDHNGELVQLFVLEQAQEIPQTTDAFHAIFLFLGMLILLFSLWRLCLNRRGSRTHKRNLF